MQLAICPLATLSVKNNFESFMISKVETKKNDFQSRKVGFKLQNLENMNDGKGGSLSCHYYSLVHSPHLSIKKSMQFKTCHYRNNLKICDRDSQTSSWKITRETLGNFFSNRKVLTCHLLTEVLIIFTIIDRVLNRG